MPCYDGPHDNGHTHAIRVAAFEDAQHSSPVAQCCCEAMKIIEAAGLTEKCSRQLKAWWKMHQRRDRIKAAKTKRP